MTDLDDYLNDLAITEILINAPDQLWIERKGQLEQVVSPWQNEHEHRQYVRSVLDQLNTDLSLQEPFCSGRMGNFRIQISGPPASNHAVVSFRRVMVQSMTLNQWIESGSMSRAVADCLCRLISEKHNILIYGATGSGKTTLLSTLISQVGHNERVILLEDIEELAVPNGASLRLLSRLDAQGVLKNISLSDLVKHSLRLRPDRLALGEVRGPEAKDLLLALATGHRGSFGTLHANSLHEALLRLEMLVQLGAPEWQTKSIRQLINLSISAVVAVKKSDNGQRVVSEIHRLTGLEDFGFLSERLA